MIDRVVCIGGPPGSGKTTAGRRVAELLDLEFRSAGELFRSQARARGMDLLEFSRFAESHYEVDRELDATMLAQASPGRLLEGRVTGGLCRRRGIASANLVVTASPSIRVGRIARRDSTTIESARQSLEEREASERKRYRHLYGIDLEIESGDFVVDSSELPIETVTARLVTFLQSAPFR